MLDYTTYIINADWSLPLLLMVLGALASLLIMAGFLTWLEAFRAYVQSESEKELSRPSYTPAKTETARHHWGWRGHHV